MQRVESRNKKPGFNYSAIVNWHSFLSDIIPSKKLQKMLLIGYFQRKLGWMTQDHLAATSSDLSESQTDKKFSNIYFQSYSLCPGSGTIFF